MSEKLARFSVRMQGFEGVFQNFDLILGKYQLFLQGLTPRGCLTCQQVETMLRTCSLFTLYYVKSVTVRYMRQ